MKTKKNLFGKPKIKLEKGEQRFGNFIARSDKDYVRFTDINGVCTHTVSMETARGVQLKEMLSIAWKKKSARQFVEAYCQVMFQTLTCVCDYDLLTALMRDSHDAIFRHKDVYGLTDEISKEEDDKILAEERELAEAEEEVRKEVNGA